MGAISAIARTTLGEAIRRKVLLIIMLIGILFLSVIPAFSVLSAKSELTTMISAMFFVLRYTSALIAIVLTVYMLPNEIERRTIYTILSKPVQRWQFLLGKYLGAIFALGLMIGMMSFLMITMFYLFQHPEVSKMFELARQALLYFVEMSLLTAVAMFFSTFVSPLVNFFISIGLWLVGTLLNPLYESISKNHEMGPVLKSIFSFVFSLLPNFANYDTKNPIINPGQAIQNETIYYFKITGYGFLYIGILLILGILIFDRREV
jgi:ABC-type transport system involved in multi-copper enzyme maturation permease subunit